MQNAIILHGSTDEEEYFNDKYPSQSNLGWIPWLQKQLLIKGILTQTPELPEAYDPNYGKWKKEFERYDISKETILVGHSCGGGFLIRWLSENKVTVKKLVLVAPWLDPYRARPTDFFDFEIDKNMQERIGEIHLFVSEDDENDIQKSVEIIESNISGIIKKTFTDKGHFLLDEMGTEKFPELLEVVL